MKKQTELKEHWEQKGFFVVNNVSTNKTGMPDLTAMKPNKVVFIESKEKNDRIRANQEARLDELTEKGFECYVNYDIWHLKTKQDTNLF